jgi:hypothetical protein
MSFLKIIVNAVNRMDNSKIKPIASRVLLIGLIIATFIDAIKRTIDEAKYPRI